jgi:glycosyltransferase involved in cell wall biosynthesis
LVSAARSVRVLHVIDGLGGGGSERWVWEIVRRARAPLQHQVVTVQPDDGSYVYAEDLAMRGAYRSNGTGALLRFLGRGVGRIAAARGAPASPRRLDPRWLFEAYTSAGWRIGKLLIRYRPDVIHAHTFHGFVLGVAFKRLLRKPLAHTVPASFVQMADAGFGWAAKRYHRLHPRVDLFFTAYPGDLLSAGVPRPKIRQIPAGVDLEAVGAVRAARDRHATEVREALGILADAPVALSVGRLHHSKGHAFALQALPAVIREIPDLHWVVLGEGTERTRLLSEASKWCVSARVHLLGYRTDSLPYYAAADLYLRTGIYEGENISSHYAMAIGLPVVGFETGMETELIPRVGHGLLVPVGDAGGLADAIGRILRLKDRGREMGERGAAYARRHLDIRKTIDWFSEAYHELASRRVRW